MTVVSGRSIGVPRLSLARLADLRNVRIEIEANAAGRGVWNVQAAMPRPSAVPLEPREKRAARVFDGDAGTLSQQ